MPRWLLAGILLLAGVLAYSNTLTVPLLLDDTVSIVENPSIRRLWPLSTVLSPPATAGVGGRPLSNLSFALNFAAGGLGVRGYHLVNLAIHLAAGLALFGLVRRTLQLPTPAPGRSSDAATSVAFTAALLWLLHPLQTESVTYISQRTESLAALFYLLTLYAFVRASQEAGRPWFLLAPLACACGMATKEIMVTAPVVVLLFDRTFVGGSFRAAWSARKRIHLSLASTWILLLFLLVDVQQRGVGYLAITGWQYALTSCQSLLVYLRLAVWPAPLVFDYGTDFVRSWSQGWPAAAGITLLLGGTIFGLWRAPKLGFLGTWIFVLLAPTTSFVPVAGQPLAEHRMYLPLAAVIVGAALAAHRWLRRGAFPVLLALGAFLLVATYNRNRDYRDAITLWTDTLAKRPLNARAHAALGASLIERGQLVPGIAALERSVQLDPASGEARNNLATALTDVNRTPEALGHFAAALRLRPGIASTHYNFGNALLSVGRTSEAIAQQEQALILLPEFPLARCALAQAQLAAGRLDPAIANFRAALRGQPDLVPAHFGLANALAQASRGTEAIPHYEATLRAVPNAVDALYFLGNALLAANRPADAAQRYSTALQLKPDFAEAHHYLAKALAQLGRTAEAIAHYEAALQLRPDFTASRANLEALRKAP